MRANCGTVCLKVMMNDVCMIGTYQHESHWTGQSNDVALRRKKKIAHKDMRLAVELSNHELKKKKWAVKEVLEDERSRRKEMCAVKDHSAGEKSKSSVAVCPVRRQCPRFQAPGYKMQSWARPGSSRISRLGGRANGALHCCPKIHCNPITLKAPQLLRRRTAGSPRRDKRPPPPQCDLIYIS